MYLSSAIGAPTMPPATPFEDFEHTESPHGPCRVIKVTEEVRRLDAVRRDAHLPADWLAHKATLSERNLRTIAPRVAEPGEIQETRRVAAPRICKCGKVVCKSAIGLYCINCTRAKRSESKKPKPAPLPRFKCDACPNILRAGRRGLCHLCAWSSRESRLRA